LALRTIAGITLQDALEYYPDPTTLAERSTLDVKELDVQLLVTGHHNPVTISDSQSFLRITVKDPDPKKVGRAFTSTIVESALATYPGMFPTAPQLKVLFGLLAEHCRFQRGSRHGPCGRPEPFEVSPADSTGTLGGCRHQPEDAQCGIPEASAALVPLGALVGARSGERAAQRMSFWVPELATGSRTCGTRGSNWLTADRVRDLLPEADPLGVDMYLPTCARSTW
jgi:hypothetical protein